MTPPGASSCCAQMDRRLAAAMRGVCLAAFALLIVLVTSLILIRFMPLFSLGWADEIVEMAFAWMTFLGTAVLWRSRTHFRVDLVPSMLAGTRAGQLLEIGLSLVSLLFLLVFTYEGAVLTLRTAIPSPILALPEGPLVPGHAHRRRPDGGVHAPGSVALPSRPHDPGIGGRARGALLRCGLPPTRRRSESGRAPGACARNP